MSGEPDRDLLRTFHRWLPLDRERLAVERLPDDQPNWDALYAVHGKPWHELMREMIDMPARTPEGIQAKARVLQAVLRSHLGFGSQPEPTPVGAAASTERERIVEQQAPFVELMVNTRAATPEGLAARARSLTLWNAELMDGGEGDVGERLTCAILRDLLERSAHEPLPTCRVHVCEDVDFASGTDEARSAHGMRRNQIFSPWTVASLALASWETIYHRTVLMANGTCSPSEYQRMVTEKLEASCTSAMAMLTGKGKTAVMAPYLKAAEANAKRLRGK